MTCTKGSWCNVPAKDNHVNKRGNTKDRAKRRAFLVAPATGFGGDGATVPCWECGTRVYAEHPDENRRLVVDRIRPGKDGGGYQRFNIRPHCHPCARRQGFEYGWGARRRHTH